MLTFAQLHQRYQETVYEHLLTICCDREVASDITQEVFIKAYRDKDNYEAHTPEQALQHLMDSANAEASLF